MLEKDKENIIIIILYRSIRESIMLVHIPRKKSKKYPSRKLCLQKPLLQWKQKSNINPPDLVTRFQNKTPQQYHPLWIKSLINFDLDAWSLINSPPLWKIKFCHDTCIQWSKKDKNYYTINYYIILILTTLCTKPNQIFLYHSYELNKRRAIPKK